MKYADYIKQIEIDSLWSGKKHVLWQLDPHVNILSNMEVIANAVGRLLLSSWSSFRNSHVAVSSPVPGVKCSA